MTAPERGVDAGSGTLLGAQKGGSHSRNYGLGCTCPGLIGLEHGGGERDLNQTSLLPVVDWVPYVLDDGTEFLFRIQDGAVVRENEATGAALMERLGRELTHLTATADGRTLVAAGNGFVRLAHVDAARLGMNEDGLVAWGFDVPLPPGMTCVAAIQLRAGEAAGVTLVATGPEESVYVYVREDGRHVTTPAEHHRELAAAGVSSDRQVVDDLGIVVHHAADEWRIEATRRAFEGRVLSIDAVVVGGEVLHLTLVENQGAVGFVLGGAGAPVVPLETADVRRAQLARGLKRVPEEPTWFGLWLDTVDGPVPRAQAVAGSAEEMFDYDVFVSYKRDDPHAPESADDVERLAARLADRLKVARLSDGRPVRYWIDRDGATGRYALTARDAIRSSATFAVLWNERSGIRASSSGAEQINQWEEVVLIRRVLEEDQLDRGVRKLAVWQANRGDERGRVEMPEGIGVWQVTKAQPVDGVEPPSFDRWVDRVIEQVELSRRQQLPDKTEMV